MLHQKGGSERVVEVHGSPRIHRCIDCDHITTFDEICRMLAEDVSQVPRCDRCGAAYKPDITFFGEPLPMGAFEEAEQLTADADLMLVLGSSLRVYPACAIPEQAARAGCPLCIVNAQPTPLDRLAVHRHKDLAAFATAVLGRGPQAPNLPF